MSATEKAAPSADDVARWMLEQISPQQSLEQETAAWEIRRLFGEEFLYQNENGNDAISKDVLKVFRQISSETVVWERGERSWRLRTERDAPGRQQEY